MRQLGTTKRRTFAYRSITLLALLAMAGAALLPLVASADNPYTTLSPRTSTARDIQTLYKIVFWLALIVFIGVQFAVAYTVLRYRRRNENEDRPEQVHGNKQVEIIWTVIPAVVLIAIFIPTVRVMFDMNAEAKEGDYQIEVYGKQWWWEVHYTKPDDVAQVITANEIYVPVGKKLQFKLFTNNVIHSFWVPQLAGKMDLIPGHINRMGFTIDKPGVYYGECAEYCGDSHALMRFKVIAVEQGDFDRWANAQVSTPGQAAAAVSGDVAKAPAAFGICIGCHRVAGTNAQAAPIGLGYPNAQGTPTSGFDLRTAGPMLTDFACRTTIAAGAMPNDEEHLREWLNDPGAVKPGNYMATVITPGLLNQPTADETDAPERTNLDVIVDYLKALQPEGGCVPITGLNAENVVTLAGSSGAAAQTAADEAAS